MRLNCIITTGYSKKNWTAPMLNYLSCLSSSTHQLQQIFFQKTSNTELWALVWQSDVESSFESMVTILCSHTQDFWSIHYTHNFKPVLKLGQVNLRIQVKWVTFFSASCGSPGQIIGNTRQSGSSYWHQGYLSSYHAWHVVPTECGFS